MGVQDILGEPIDTAFGKLPKDKQKAIYGYVDTDSVKQILNAQYGKEVGMKDYIVVHRKDTKNTGIIFKKSIDAILEREDETCLIVSGYSVYCEDNYKDVVAKVLK